jgi:uncharacterized membrane protein
MDQPARTRSSRPVWPWFVALFLGIVLAGCGNDGPTRFVGIAIGVVALTALLLPNGERSRDVP